jgi:hypothetical protein
MLTKIWEIFNRDVKVSLRNSISLFILIIPLVLSIGINLFTPGINDTTVNIAFLDGENPKQVAYFEQFAKVKLFKDIEKIKERVKARDSMVGILPDGDHYYIMTQGNESDDVIDFAKALNSLNELDVQMDESNAEIFEFGRTVPPLKRILVNGVILLLSMMGGMLIAFNIVEEKSDHTISAINVTPTTRKSFIIGKSMLGLIFPIFGTIVTVFITEFSDVNFFQLFFIVSASSMLSLLVGFIQGLYSDDIISAASTIKLLFLPLVASVLAVELLADKWQKIFYWSPFYWAYKGNDAVLSQTASWVQILSYTAIVLVLCGVVYIFLSPKIRKGLE